MSRQKIRKRIAAIYRDYEYAFRRRKGAVSLIRKFYDNAGFKTTDKVKVADKTIKSSKSLFDFAFEREGKLFYVIYERIDEFPHTVSKLVDKGDRAIQYIFYVNIAKYRSNVYRMDSRDVKSKITKAHFDKKAVTIFDTDSMIKAKEEVDQELKEDIEEIEDPDADKTHKVKKKSLKSKVKKRLSRKKT
jgi:hypothetical protein